jgi:RNA polymerase sigma-70 factor (ECF subfamily)
MSLQLTTDKQLIDSYLAGSHSSLEVLIHRHKKRVYSYIYMVVKDKHLAEDIFQDTFVKVVNSLRSGAYNDTGKFLPWVMRIAHNITIDHFRISKRIPYVHNSEEKDIFEFIHILEHSTEDKMVIDQIHKNVKALLEFLPPEQKEVIIMRHYYDMSFKEISEEIDTSLNTVLGRMRYGLINLRKIIEQKQLVMTP